jgi:hypothetical protein
LRQQVLTARAPSDVLALLPDALIADVERCAA